MTTIVIDPGHGGARPQGSSTPLGAMGPTGLREKDVTLDVARRLACHLGGRAVLTRSLDENLSLGQRIAAARRAAADVFLSIHANAGPPGARGAEIWVHERGGAGSVALAQTVAAQLRRLGSATKVYRGALGVLSPEHHARDTAACLVELDYLSDPGAERRLRDPGTLDAFATVLAQGARHVDPGYGRGGEARALDAGSLDEKWPTRPAKLIPDETPDSPIIQYTTDALEAIGAVFGVSAWDDVVAAGEKELEEKLKDALEQVEKISEKAAAFAVVVGLLAIAELAPLGIGYAQGREKVGKSWATRGFATGLVWTADDRAPTDVRKGPYQQLWLPAGLPAKGSFAAEWDEAVPRIARNCYRMGLIAGMAAGRQLTTTQKNNLFTDLEKRDLSQEDQPHMEWYRLWENWGDPATRPIEFYWATSSQLMRAHMAETD